MHRGLGADVAIVTAPSAYVQNEALEIVRKKEEYYISREIRRLLKLQLIQIILSINN